MKRTLMVILAVLLLIAAVNMAFAEAVNPFAENPFAADPLANDPFAAERASSIAAVQNEMPDAVIDYAVRERDDGRYEWNVFFRQNGVLGEAEVIEGENTIRRVQLFSQSDETSLSATDAMAKLAQEKGLMTIVDLELDWDDGRLTYSGEAEMNGYRYEFEITVNGVIIEWERD